MGSGRVLIGCVLCLAVGLGLILGFCSGTTGFSFAYPFSAASIHIDITTTGLPAVAGVVLTGIGCLLLVLALIMSMAGQMASSETPVRREEPFQE
ncbi:MAG: hypothetical protein WAM85_20310 [Terracidiphilus sp.]